MQIEGLQRRKTPVFTYSQSISRYQQEISFVVDLSRELVLPYHQLFPTLVYFSLVFQFKQLLLQP